VTEREKEEGERALPREERKKRNFLLNLCVIPRKEGHHILRKGRGNNEEANIRSEKGLASE